jgi:ectoine hydroxylase-related dioxygenase (phytanoyl-CoA dioxygenase family)
MTTDLYQSKPFFIEYNTELYNFRKCIEEMMGNSDLEHLHLLQNYSLLDREHDQSTIWHKKYYDQFSKFNEIYIAFIKNYLKPLLGIEKLVYQKIPTFRVHLVGNLAVGEWHKDRTYHHGRTEVNCWLPFTNTFGNNTIWTESEEDLGDYKPYEVNQGQIFVFNGANLNHGNKLNDTEHCRISVDFRLVDYAKFIPSEEGSINLNTKFDIGGYFDLI